ncbi:MAG: hypothetical protein DHS20C01_23390 [marine bacterium B5-7]|nr:MAG: hypothetical protein DHS20C01_23390 [marine bacterium B5-7]
MSSNRPELFTSDLKFLVDADPPHRKRRGNHSHWLLTGFIAVLVGVWLGSDPSASIGNVDSNSNRRLASNTTSQIPLIDPDFESFAISTFDDSNNVDHLDNSSAESVNVSYVALSQNTETDQSIDDVFDWPDNRQAITGVSFGPLLGDSSEITDRYLPATLTQPEFTPNLEAINTIPHGDALDEAVETTEIPSSRAVASIGVDPLDGYKVTTDFDLSAMDVESGTGWQVINIRKGDTLSKIFGRLGIDPELTHRLTSNSEGKRLNALQTGPNLKVLFDEQGQLESLRYNIDAVRILVANFSDTQIDTSIEERTIEIRQRQVNGTIRSSLFRAATEAGLSDQFTLHLASIFKWNIDFTRDLHPGDRFAVIFEEKFIDDRKIATGEIVAAAFSINDRKYTAIRHVEANGDVNYYSSDGQSLRRAFLRSPVKFSRISSGFSPKRYHPILKRWKAHNGVDYAAPRGTPVLATAGGVIDFVGRKGGYGKAVIIQHGRKYSTLYGHLDRFGKKIRTGMKVQQGDIIGYVGSTGLATGPHLHYEFRIAGKHKNPLTVDVPRALPITGAERTAFLKMAGSLERRLIRIQ